MVDIEHAIALVFVAAFAGIDLAGQSDAYCGKFVLELQWNLLQASTIGRIPKLLALRQVLV